MSDTPKLLPCPFCGEPFPYIENERLGPGIWFKCRKCFCQTSGHAVTTESAMVEWNRRAAPAWSSDPPTEPGWHWYYDPNDPGIDFPEMAVISGDSAFFVSENVADITRYFVDALKGRWIKIAEPELPPSE